MRFRILLAVPLLLLAAGPAAAQDLRGRLEGADSGEPVDGALVVLETGEGAGRDTTFSGAGGGFELEAPSAGSYRLRVQRIGFRNWTSPTVEIGAGETVRRTFRVPRDPVRLTDLEVTGERQCGTPRYEGELLTEVWEEIRKALEAVRLSTERGMYEFSVRAYRRTLDPDASRVREEDVSTYTARGNEPFMSLPAEQLAEKGYVSGDLRTGRTWYAPDLRTLLSGAFQRTHCFRVRRTEGDGQRLLAVEFRPAPGRDVPDIEGTLRVEEETAELRELEYDYVNVELGENSRAVGGRLLFQSLPSGGWVIRDWRIRMPNLRGERAWWDEDREAALEVESIRETGRAITRIRSPEGELLYDLERASLTGVVRDSTRGEPLSGAVVRVAGTDWTDTTDAGGAFRITGLSEGRYGVTFAHPRLDSLGVVRLPEREVAVARGEVSRVRLAVPGWRTLLAAACDGDGRHLVGRVRDRLTDRPLGSVRVEARTDGDEAPVATARTAAHGGFRLCGLEADSVRLTVGRSGMALERRTVRLSAEKVTRTDVALRISDPAAVVGRLVAADGGGAVAGATVHLSSDEAGPFTAASGTEGRFRIDSLPPGRYRMRVEHVGYRTGEDSVLVAGADTVRLTARLASEAVEVEPLQVTVEGEEIRGLAGADARAVRAYTLDREEIEEINAAEVGQLVRRLNAPGLSVRTMRGLQQGVAGDTRTDEMTCIESSRTRPRPGTRCQMVQVYVDGARVNDPRTFLSDLDPDVVERIEFVPAVEAGARFGTGSGNGVLLVYTGTGGGR